MPADPPPPADAPSADAPLAAAVAGTGCGVFWLDEDLRVRRANAAFAQFCGAASPGAAANLAGTPITDLDPAWPHGGAAEAFAELKARGGAGHATTLPGGWGLPGGPGGGRGVPVQVHLNYLSLGGFESLFGVAVDVSDRQAAEDALRHSQDRYKAVTDAQTEYILRFKPAGGPDGQNFTEQTVTFCNRAFARLVDAGDPGQVIGRPMPGLVHPDDRDLVNARVAAITPDNPVSGGENRVLAPDGRELWTSWINTGIFAPADASGPARLLEVQAVGRDVTDRVLADQALARARERYASLVEDSPELVSRWRPDGTLTYANAAYIEFFGLPPGPAGDHNVLAGLSDPDRQKLDRALAALTPETPLARVVTRKTRRDGAEREIEWIERGFFKKAPDGRETGELIEIQSVGRDATDRREARRALRRSESMMRGVLDDMEEMVVRFRPDGTYTYANRAFCQSRGTTPEEIVRCTIFGGLTEEAAESVREQIAGVTPASPRTSGLIPRPGGDGATRWEEWTTRAIYTDPDPADPSAEPRVVVYQSVGRDVTGEVAGDTRRRAAADAAAKLEKLSPREREVLTAVADGTTNKVIAVRLGITERTVEKHRSAAMRKLGVRSAAELVRVAVAAEAAAPPPA